jgi:hypothetical protein
MVVAFYQYFINLLLLRKPCNEFINNRFKCFGPVVLVGRKIPGYLVAFFIGLIPYTFFKSFVFLDRKSVV